MSHKNQTITFTFGDCAENHVGMQKISGKTIKSGMTYKDLSDIYWKYTDEGVECLFYELKDLLPKKDREGVEDAYFLVVKNGINHTLKMSNKSTKNFPTETNKNDSTSKKDKEYSEEANISESKEDEEKEVYTDKDLFDEHIDLKWDKKAFMKGKVVNKIARWNLCYGDFTQKPDYENKKGRVYNFNKLPVLNCLREKIGGLLKSDKLEDLQVESNFYYDIKKNCYISLHSDLERVLVVGLRLGATLPLYFQWYHRFEPEGKLFKINLENGDMYFFSSKAVGTDGRKSSIYTLRHAAGLESVLAVKQTKSKMCKEGLKEHIFKK